MDPITAVVTAVTATPWALVVLFLCCAVDGFFPPIPSELALTAMAAIAVASGTPFLPAVIVVAIAGAWAGDITAYHLGRRLGWTPFRWMRRERVQRAVTRIQGQLAIRPASILVTGRFVPVGRVLVNMAAGASRMPRRSFLPLSLLASAAWTSLTVVIAVLAGAMFHGAPLLAAATAMTVAFAAGYCVDRVVATRRNSPVDQEVTS